MIALAQRPDIFKLAIAGAPVTKWTLYDSGYTERYMDTPMDNVEGLCVVACYLKLKICVLQVT